MREFAFSYNHYNYLAIMSIIDTSVSSISFYGLLAIFEYLTGNLHCIVYSIAEAAINLNLFEVGFLQTLVVFKRFTHQCKNMIS